MYITCDDLNIELSHDSLQRLESGGSEAVLLYYNGRYAMPKKKKKKKKGKADLLLFYTLEGCLICI